MSETSALVAHNGINAGVPGDRHCCRAYEEKPLQEYTCSANRHKVLTKTNPKKVERLLRQLHEAFDRRWQTYTHLSRNRIRQSKFEQTG